MAMNKIKTVRPHHEAIMDWMLANPRGSMRECALEFGVTQAWLSVIVNSDVFKSRLKEKSQECFETTVIPLREKMLGVAHLAFERLGEMVEASPDPRFILDAADKTAHRLGYAPTKGPEGPAQPTQQNNFFFADKNLLADARSRVFLAQPVEAQEGELLDVLPAPEKI